MYLYSMLERSDFGFKSSQVLGVTLAGQSSALVKGETCSVLIQRIKGLNCLILKDATTLTGE